MSFEESYKVYSKRDNIYINVTKGHFATGNCHTNYYIDTTWLKHRLSVAQRLANILVTEYKNSTVVDSILCIDGTEIVGTCIAQSLTSAEFTNMNAHQTIYILSPENTVGNQMIFRDNMIRMINGKHVLIVAANITTGQLVQSAINSVKYYGGPVAGISAVFSVLPSCDNIPIISAFGPDDIPDYASYPSHDCPICKSGQKVDAIVNSYGYSKL
ncbi:MAG: orotate phosphoribosyltransferase [Oscillospiraceae bacterium]|nr:orotate phosphoribosyltransferase [Candidatus Equicaccousia limihippi]